MSAVDRQGGADLAGQWDTDPEGLISRSPPYGSHLGQRSWHRTSKAGHMTASAFAHPLQFLLASRGPSTHDPRIHVVAAAASIRCKDDRGEK